MREEDEEERRDGGKGSGTGTRTGTGSGRREEDEEEGRRNDGGKRRREVSLVGGAGSQKWDRCVLVHAPVSTKKSSPVISTLSCSPSILEE